MTPTETDHVPELRWTSLSSGALRTVGTVIWNAATQNAVLIDPTDQPSTFLDALRERGLTLRHLLLTHGHVDHAAGCGEVHSVFGVAPRLHRDDFALYATMPAWGRALGLNLSEPSVQPQPLEDNEIVAVEAGFSLRVLHTPGHSPGQVAYYVEALQLLVVGDTLFFGSVGRSDLPGGNSKQLIESIRSRLYTLPDDTKVVPGHGPHTTIGREKRENPFVRAD